MQASALLLCSLIAIANCSAQAQIAGRRQYESHCAGCHGGDGNGGELGPAIVTRLASRGDQDLAALIRNGIPASGMPAFKLTAVEARDLIAFLRTLRPRPEPEPVRARVETTDGRTLEGRVMNRSLVDLQLQTEDLRIHLLRKAGDHFRPVTSQTDWPTYNGQPGGNRFSTLDQINRSNVARLAPKWIFSIPDAPPLEGTPVVADGIMYVTSANECYALDAGNGRRVWRYRRPRTKALVGNAAGGINRGVALAGDRVFMVTDHAHIIALNKFTGALLWETEMANWHLNYNATSAPLVVDDLVVSGTAGGDEGARGFLAAFDQNTGKEVWRFWTVPKPGEPGSETWKGGGILHPAASTWLTGTYDPQLHTVYWPTGNPGPDYNGDAREGDNLYSDSVVALDARTGKLKWYFQYTPNDQRDWDAAQTPVLIDADWEGNPRKLLLHANRNGFFYVLDRTNGKMLLAKPFVKKVTWAREISPDGRPVLVPNQVPTLEGTKICPAVEGATNWFSPSFNPSTGFYYVQTLEKCNLYKKSAIVWQAGKAFFGGTTRDIPGDSPQKILRAIDIRTGKIAWELPQNGRAESWGGTLATATGLVFFCEDIGAFMAVDAVNGTALWSFQTNHDWKASPMTYMFDNRQYLAVAAGSEIIAFSLVER